MKATPKEYKAMQKMQPGVITLNGFLGSDNRNLNEIIAEDQAALDRLGYSAGQIAERMEYFTKLSWESYLEGELIDGIYLVQTDVYRGKLPCPFGHSGIYRKATTRLTNTTKQIEVCWSSLNIHLIGEHGFFEGRGSTFRLDPETLVKALF